MPTVLAMEDVGVRELRQNLSVYLRRIAKGETLRVTDHGHPVALLTPLRHTENSVLDAMEARGELIRPRPGSRRRRPVPLPPDGGPTLSEVLQQMRDEDDR